MHSGPFLAGASIDLYSGWKAAYAPIQDVLGSGLLKVAAAIGVLMVFFAFGKFAYDKKKGGGGNSSALLWTLLIGALLTGPDLIMPSVLWVFDGVANTVIKLFTSNGAPAS